MFDKSILGLKKETILESELFVSLPDPKTLRPLTRKSFLETADTGSLLDIFRGADFSFKRTKPQIVFFEDIKIGFDTLGVRRTAGEFEDIIAQGKIIRRKGKKTATIFGGRRVEIIGAEIVEPTPQLKSLIKSQQEGIITPIQSNQLIKQLSKQSGFDIKDIISRPKQGDVFISPTATGVSGFSKVGRVAQKSIFPQISFKDFDKSFSAISKPTRRKELIDLPRIRRGIISKGDIIDTPRPRRGLSFGGSGFSRRNIIDIGDPLIPGDETFIIPSINPIARLFGKARPPGLKKEDKLLLPFRKFQRTPSLGAVLKLEFNIKQPKLSLRAERTGLVERAFIKSKLIKPLGAFKL